MESSSSVAEPAFLLDSNICIYLLAGLSLETKARAEACRPGELVTSAVAYAEVMVGARRDATMNKADALFGIVSVLPFDTAAGRAYARLPFKRARFDRLIAAHALSLDLTLVTANDRDFADVVGLKVENWTV